MGPPWKAAAVSVVGTGHLEHGEACGDASNVVWNDELQILVLVAADGAGVAKHASSGSARAVAAISRRAPALLKRQRANLDDPERLQELLIELARDTRAQLALAAAQGEERIEATPIAGEVGPSTLNDYATTLLVAILTTGHLATLQVGDGFIVVTRNPPAMHAVFRPSKGEFANQTCFLTSFESFAELAANRQVQVQVRPSAGISGIALITDGLENVAMNMRGGGTPHAPFFLDLMRKLLELEPAEYANKLRTFLLGNERIKAKTDDDKTLVLAVNTQDPPDLTPEHYPQTPSGQAGSSDGGGGSGSPRRTPPKPKVIELADAEVGEEGEATTGSTVWSLQDFAAEPTAPPSDGAQRPAATTAAVSHARRSFLRGFLTALALVALPLTYLSVPRVRTWVAQTVNAVRPTLQAEPIRETTPGIDETMAPVAVANDPAAGQPAAAPGSTELVLELCLAVTASQIEAGRSRPESDLGVWIAEFDPDFDPLGGPFCLPRSGGAFEDEAVRVRPITQTNGGAADIRFVPEDEYTVSPEILPDRRIYTYALASTPADGSLRYAFDIALDPEFGRCGGTESPVIAAGGDPDIREVFVLCR